MTTFSKYFNEISIKNALSCKAVLHPTESCNEMLVNIAPYILAGCTKFFFPLFFIPLLANPSALTKEKFIDACHTCANSVQTGFFSAITILFLVCKTYHFRQKITYGHIIYFPSIIGGWPIYFANDHVKLLFGHTAAIIIMEILIRDGRLAPLRWIQRSNAIRTFIFMSLSAFILDCLQTSGGKVFWLVKPSRRSTNELMEDKKENKKQCLHEYDCQSHLIQTVKTYATIGLALEAIKGIISNFSGLKQNPLQSISRIGNQLNYKFLIFFVGYPTLYKFLNCFLTKKVGKTDRFSHSVAAFVGGLPFYVYSNELPLLCHGLASAFELAWTKYLNSLEKSSKEYKYASKIPFSSLLYIFGGGFMYTMKVFYPYLAPKFLNRLVELISHDKFTIIAKQVHSLWLPDVIV